jgi:hypothetical protein
MDRFQHWLARIALEIVGSRGFVLGGGQAVQIHGMGARPSEDVDLFCSRRGSPTEVAEDDQTSPPGKRRANDHRAVDLGEGTLDRYRERGRFIPRREPYVKPLRNQRDLDPGRANRTTSASRHEAWRGFAHQPTIADHCVADWSAQPPRQVA